MHGIAVYSKNQTNGVTYDPLNTVVDQSLTPAQSSGYIFPKNYRVLAAAVMGVNVTAARINAPSLRNFVLPEIVPALPSATLTTRPPIIDYRQQGPVVMQNEAVVVETSSGGAAAGIVSAALWLTDRFTPAPGGQVFTGVGTFTMTLIANSWVLAPLTFTQGLPAGKYQVVGMECVVANSFVARLVFPGMNQWRPGCVVDSAYGNIITPPIFRYGYMGLYGEFYNTAQPQIEVFGLVAGAVTGTAYLDMIKIG